MSSGASAIAQTQVRWGIIGAASIARHQFLPGLREAGGGRAVLVGSRDLRRGEEFAAQENVTRAVEGYDAVLESGDVDAVYIALPNSLHAEWTIAALEAGLTVLSEKPLTHDVETTDSVLAAAQKHPGSLLWEAFVFPFQAQHKRIRELIDAGAVGEVEEIDSHFHFMLGREADIRLSGTLGGGALADVGCYPIRLAHELLGPARGRVCAHAAIDGEVEVDAAGLVEHGAQRLLFSCGFRRPYDTFTRILGSEGELRLSNPYHPKPADTIELRHAGDEPRTERPTHDEHSFAAIIRHMHAVIREDADPLQLALSSAASTARTLAALQRDVWRDRRPGAGVSPTANFGRL